MSVRRKDPDTSQRRSTSKGEETASQAEDAPEEATLTDDNDKSGETSSAESSAKSSETSSRKSSARRPNATKLVRAACRQLEELVGKPIDGVSGFERDGDGWRILLEVEELTRIPASTSLLATYEVVVDRDGALMEYGRLRRYYRNQADDGS